MNNLHFAIILGMQTLMFLIWVAREKRRSKIIDKIVQLRELGYSFDHYIDQVIEAFKKEDDHDLQ